MGLLQNLPQIFVTWKDVNWTFNSINTLTELV